MLLTNKFYLMLCDNFFSIWFNDVSVPTFIVLLFLFSVFKSIFYFYSFILVMIFIISMSYLLVLSYYFLFKSILLPKYNWMKENIFSQKQYFSFYQFHLLENKKLVFIHLFEILISILFIFFFVKNIFSYWLSLFGFVWIQ